ncbi:MAG: MotA/TolQ/ExbB proton channel family protein [Rhodospirillales bacterium]|nr:MotA/TolQ/ExbB proton channel family protein [Rhodospirillales bacterium]
MTSVSETQGRRPRPQVPRTRHAARVDFATLIGVFGGFAMIGTAMVVGGSAASFFNLPGMLIVLGGTFLVTTISFTLEEVLRTQKVMLRAVLYRAEVPEEAALEMLGLADLARKGGVLALQPKLPALNHSGYLRRAMEMVIDGLPAEEVVRILDGELRETMRRHQRAAGVLRRGGEVAPAMGLIGTLVGLVQMLGNLEDPSSIGPAMAVALLTTFYGAILANMVFNPVASKLERNSEFEAMVNQIYAAGAASISRQDNPRRLEILLNTILPPTRRVTYFD